MDRWRNGPMARWPDDPMTQWPDGEMARWLTGGQGVQEVRAGLCLGESFEQKFHAFGDRERIENLPQDPDSIQVCLGDQQFFFACFCFIDIDCREAAPIHT